MTADWPYDPPSHYQRPLHLTSCADDWIIHQMSQSSWSPLCHQMCIFHGIKCKRQDSPARPPPPSPWPFRFWRMKYGFALSVIHNAPASNTSSGMTHIFLLFCSLFFKDTLNTRGCGGQPSNWRDCVQRGLLNYLHTDEGLIFSWAFSQPYKISSTRSKTRMQVLL